MAMEITTQKDDLNQKIYTTTIQVNNKVIILDTLWHGRCFARTEYDIPVNDWVCMVKKLQEKKRKNKTFIISLVADRSEHYRNSSYIDNPLDHISKNPIELLQVCVDTHCLFHETEIPTRYNHGYPKYSPPTALLKLFTDIKTVVVGLGIEDLAKKLENDFNIKISNCVDLRYKAREKGIYGDIPNNCSVEKLAKKVLGDEWDVIKPVSMEWWTTESIHAWNLKFLSDEKVKFGTLEAFLAYRIGRELLKD